eukprot:m.800750 g.800750  ORF g.800750 m.800750 type:complete len:180 (+) comp23357_c0_seq21:562-1101(+)
MQVGYVTSSEHHDAGVRYHQVCHAAKEPRLRHNRSFVYCLRVLVCVMSFSMPVRRAAPSVRETKNNKKCQKNIINGLQDVHTVLRKAKKTGRSLYMLRPFTSRAASSSMPHSVESNVEMKCPWTTSTTVRPAASERRSGDRSHRATRSHRTRDMASVSHGPVYQEPSEGSAAVSYVGKC